MYAPCLRIEGSEAPRGGAGIEIDRDLHHGPEPEAPRGGAGIEIRSCPPLAGGCQKPLVEGLVLKSDGHHHYDCVEEAPRGGAGIEIILTLTLTLEQSEAPRGGAGIEIASSKRVKRNIGSPSWRGWY